MRQQTHINTHFLLFLWGGLSLPLTHREAIKEDGMTTDEGEEEQCRMKNGWRWRAEVWIVLGRSGQ